MQAAWPTLHFCLAVLIATLLLPFLLAIAVSVCERHGSFVPAARPHPYQ